jgi:hypothetical protein
MSKNYTLVVYKTNQFYKIFNMVQTKSKKSAPAKKSAKKSTAKKTTKSKGKK